jgi:hypothetical protein
MRSWTRALTPLSATRVRIVTVKPLERRDLASLLSRDWERVRRHKRARLANVLREEDPLTLLARADALRRHVRAVNAAYPDAHQRAADAAHHAALRAKLTRIADAGFRARNG